MELEEQAAALPAWRAAGDQAEHQAEQLLGHFDDEELFDLASLYGTVLSAIEGEIQRIAGDPTR